jgi:hypothetical protein
MTLGDPTVSLGRGRQHASSFITVFRVLLKESCVEADLREHQSLSFSLTP